MNSTDTSASLPGLNSIVQYYNSTKNDKSSHEFMPKQLLNLTVLTPTSFSVVSEWEPGSPTLVTL